MSAADHGPDDHAGTTHASSTDAGHDGHHGDTHGDAHGHGEEALGPLDGRAWGAAALGIASGLLVVIVLWAAANPA